MRLLVTGGAGFIGSNFIRYWLNEHPDDEAVSLDALTYAGDRGSLADVEAAHGPRYAFEQGDIADIELVTRLLRERRIDTVVNFAAESHNSRGVLDPSAFMRTNALGTQLLLDAIRQTGTPRFHHISTCEVYGDLPLDSPATFTESSSYRPRTPYNASKASADMIVRAYHATWDLPVTISVCSNNYGPFQHPEKAIPKFITQALDGRSLPVYRSSANRREWLHVNDHCRAIDAILHRGTIGETYNVGSGVEKSIDEIADGILELTSRPPSLKEYVPDRPGHDRRYLLDHGKIERDLGWRPQISFADGLRDTVLWYREHRSWWAPKRDALLGLNEAAWSTRSA
jgi:dTDP-glucose 4,6-dehydratase